MTLANLLLGSALLLVLASIPRDTKPLRGALILVGAAGLVYVILHGRGLLPAAACAALMLVSAARLLFSIRWGAEVRLSAEEIAMIERSFPGIPRATARALLDQGLWVQGKPGEVLVHEATPVTHLFYLSEGTVSVSSGGRELATSDAGHFFGEITVLSGGPATATVTLATPARFWCASADALHAFLAVNPSYRAILEAAFAGDLRDKLRLANQRVVSLEAAVSGASAA